MCVNGVGVFVSLRTDHYLFINPLDLEPNKNHFSEYLSGKSVRKFIRNITSKVFQGYIVPSLSKKVVKSNHFNSINQHPLHQPL